MKANKKCETCSSAAIITERFCGKCKKAVLKKLQELKYLQPDPYGFGVPQYGRGMTKWKIPAKPSMELTKILLC